MKVCSFCGKQYKILKGLCANTFLTDDTTIIIEDLLKIFRSEIVEAFSLDLDCSICQVCLQQLEDCYKFVQQVREVGKQLKILATIKQQSEEIKDNLFSEQCKPTSAVRSNTKAWNFKVILPRLHDDYQQLSPGPPATQAPNFVSRLYKCLECTQSFKSFKSLREHEAKRCNNTTTVSGVFVCKLCHICHKEESSLADHYTKMHENQQFVCCLCNDKEFSSRGYLTRHITKVHEHVSLKYFCGECQELLVFNEQESVRKHFQEAHSMTHSKKDKNQDKRTDALNEDDMDLEMHEEFLDEFLLAHTNENSFQFSECWEALDLHLPDMLPNNSTNFQNGEFSEAFPCPKCFEQFKKPQHLLWHLAELHDMPVLICRNCRKAFASYKNFKSHKINKCPKDDSIEPLHIPCPYCKKTFGTSLSLKQHLRIVHTHLKLHICQLCDKQFSTLDHLKKHVLSQHQNERKHICHICSKAFTQHCHLKQHLAIHTTGKTLQCSDCPMKFWRKIDMQRHQIKRHGRGDS